MSDKFSCKNCSSELTEEDKICPSCGSTKIQKDFYRSATVAIGLKASAEATHEAKMSASGWAILGLLLTLIYSIALFVIGSLNLALWIRSLIAFGVLVLGCATLFISRYRVIMLLRQVDKAFTGKRTFRT